MKVMMVGDLVGAQGRTLFAQVVTRYKERNALDFVVVNAENAAGGRGITPRLANELFSAGADVVTLGDHAWDQKELISQIDREPRLLRPANFSPGCPGRGLVTVDTPWGRVTVINLIGRVFMKPYDCPFRCADALLAQGGLGKVVIVDMHAEATSEKIVMGRYLDGRVSALAGTHTHVQTSDEVLLPKGTAYLTDLGMTGVKDSSLGRDLESVYDMFLTGMPTKFKLAQGESVLEGLWIDIDETTGRARKVKRLRETAMGPAKTALG